MRVLTGYIGTGYAFGIHLLRDVYQKRSPGERPVHFLIITDSDIFSMLEEVEGRKKVAGWSVAKTALEECRGGGTYLLEIPRHYGAKNEIQRMRGDGWYVDLVDNQQQMVEFAREFAKRNYESGKGVK